MRYTTKLNNSLRYSRILHFLIIGTITLRYQFGALRERPEHPADRDEYGEYPF